MQAQRTDGLPEQRLLKSVELHLDICGGKQPLAQDFRAHTPQRVQGDMCIQQLGGRQLKEGKRATWLEMHTQKRDRSAHIYFEELRTGAAQTRRAEVLSQVCVRSVEQTNRVVVQVDNQLHSPHWKNTLKGVWWRVIVPREPEELDDTGKRRLGKV